MMDYAEQENKRLHAVRAFIPGIIERQTKHVNRDPALALLIEHFELDPNTSLDHLEAELYLRVDGLPPALSQHKQPLSQPGSVPVRTRRQ